MSKRNSYKNENAPDKKADEAAGFAEKVIDDKPENPKTKKKRNRFAFFKDERTHKVFGLILLLISVVMFFSFASFIFTWKEDDSIYDQTWDVILSVTHRHAENWLGNIGAILSHLFVKDWFGIASFLIPFVLFVTGARIVFNTVTYSLEKVYGYSIFFIIWLSITFGFLIRAQDYLYIGGAYGYFVNKWLESVVGMAGTIFVLVFSMLIFLVIAFNISFRRPPKPVIAEETVMNKENVEAIPESEVKKENTPKPVDLDMEIVGNDGEEETEEDEEEEEPLIEEPFIRSKSKDKKAEHIPLAIETSAIEEAASEIKVARNTIDTPFDPTLELSSYKFPTIDLLENYGSNKIQVNNEELVDNKNKIVETLGHYDIKIDKIKATVGPTVTLYEIIPAAGVRIAKIKNLEDDIALSLSALGIRIIAPIPGKGTIGIEVPNSKPETVSMRSIIGSEKFQNSDYDLPIGLGKTISNEVFVADLAKMPHLLMAGATGQGKSVGLNAVLVSLLYKKHPSQIKFVLVDPKKVELTLFKKIERHFLAKLPGDDEDAIITDTKRVIKTLNSLCIEMDHRYDLLKDAQVRNLKEYNAKFIQRKLNPNEGHHFLPYIILVIDEFADLIMTAGKEVELPIARLAQLARAIGIHLIIATQRPSVNIITGTIKANFPARIAFRVTSKIDSRTILDAGGADQLVGRGDMLLSTGADIIRLQCAFVDTPEVEKITSFIGDQRGYADAYRLPEVIDESQEGGGEFDSSQKDSMFNEAAYIIVQHQQGSASLLQRKLKLGYNRAGRIIDQLESAGIIGPFEGSKAREVLIKDILSLEQHLEKIK
jgi:S-DNA-T family DNA segregation ATPase FtsK/SpoIIIE